MASASDRLVGMLFMSAALAIFIYWTTWTILMPFVDIDHPLQAFFPDRFWSLLIPSVGGMLMLTALLTLTGMVLSKSAAKTKPKTG